MKLIAALFLITAISATVIADTPELKFRDMYSQGQDFSELIESLEGERVTITGFMAPPLKPDAEFFVLTKMPMAVCPFCEAEADWPDDIVFVRMEKDFRPVYFNAPIEVEGVLQLGVDIDDETGFVSLVRLTEADYRIKR